MDLDTVGGLVNELLSAYDAALEYYTKWQRRKWQENHYRTHDKGKLSGSGSCGLSTSLNISGPLIRKAYTGAAEALGESFSVGDKTCCGVLHGNLNRLQTHVDTLYKAMTSENGPLLLAEILQTSEAVRISTIATLENQRKRLSVGRPISLLSTATRRRSRLGITPLSAAGAAAPAVPSEASTEKGMNDDFDVRTVYRYSGSNRSPFQSEPPSPPPTPKLIPDDLQSACASTPTSASSSARPKASVFSMFCPEAMKYQVDVRKAMPAKSLDARSSRMACRRCGYDWYGWLAADSDLNLMVKDGFRMTPRFLGKSHCEGGFGCVLCTSSGKTETYKDANALRDHINAAHTKWQMLHDVDMVGRL